MSYNKHDEFQQLKGFLGQEIVKFYLKEVEKLEIMGEEVKIEGIGTDGNKIKGSLRLDLVVKNKKNLFLPVEIKFQKYNFESFGQAFEYVLEKFLNNERVKVLFNNNEVELSKPPLLFLWYPPSSKIKNKKGCNIVEYITFETIFKKLKKIPCFKKKLIKELLKKIKDFLENNDFTLKDTQRAKISSIFGDKDEYQI